MNNNIGLNENDLKQIVTIISNEQNVEEAIIFGSRAKGNYKNGSDVDIALIGKQLTLNNVTHISYMLNEETNMPYKFDVLNYHRISNNDLLSHINRVGIHIYKNTTHS